MILSPSKQSTMKSLLTICAILISTMTFSQTTWDEYNYCVGGYQDVLEKGMNPKIGYRVTEVTNKTLTQGDDTERNVSVRALYRKSTGKIAAYILIYRLRTEPRQYYCIPHPSSPDEMRDLFLQSLPSDGKSIYQLRAITYAIAMGLKW